MTRSIRILTRPFLGTCALLSMWLAWPGCACGPATMTVMHNETVPMLSATPLQTPRPKHPAP